jgi:FdhE protein
MAGGFLHKFFGSTPMVSPEIEAARSELQRLGQERPELAGSIAFLSEILPQLQQEPNQGSLSLLVPEQASAKLAGGVPLLRGERLSLNLPAFRQRWLAVCAAVQRHQDGDMGKLLAEALRHERLDPDELTREILAGRPEGVYRQAEPLALDAGLTATVLRLTLFPVLTQVNVALAPLREGVVWQHGYCPTCGSWPLLGEYRGLEQTRFLRCGLCAVEWEFPRLLCPYCGTRDHHVLGYFHVEGEEMRHRASTCDACRGYVKMISTLTALTGPQLLVAELATMHLDLAAAERGYAVSP